MARIERGLELERIVYFSDAVFAIAMTLVALTIPVPHLANGATDADFVNALSNDQNSLLAYFISFAVIALFWLAHHRIFALIVRWKRGLLVRNLAFLLLIAILPWPTQILAEYGNLTGPTVLYASVVAAVGLAMFWTWSYATRNHLVIEGLSARESAYGTTRSLLAPVIFLLSIPIAFVSPTIAQLSWLAIIPVEAGLEAWARRNDVSFVSSSDDVVRVAEKTEAKCRGED